MHFVFLNQLDINPRESFCVVEKQTSLGRALSYKNSLIK